ncbi:MAG: peptidylprolyl isomerase [Gemmatimonadaceae bacterium]
MRYSWLLLIAPIAVTAGAQTQTQRLEKDSAFFRKLQEGRRATQAALIFPAKQLPLERMILEVEHTRSINIAPLIAAIGGKDVRLQRLAARTAGRLERPELASEVLPLMTSANVDVRLETASALGQMNARVDYYALLQAEKDGVVRGELLTTVGRVMPAIAGAEAMLATGLDDATSAGRTGAIRGIESLFRQNRSMRASPATLEKLRAAFKSNSGAIPRQLALLTLNASNGGDSSTYALALRDTSAQVRRLAVAGSKQWIADAAPMVRYQALRTANNCARAEAAITDANEGVALAAIDIVGDKKCSVASIDKVVTSGKTWRMQAHALVALAKIAPDVARTNLSKFATHSVWQARVYAATAARLLGDSATLAKLARDAEPNVAIEAMSTPADAIRALNSNHSGLVRAGALKLKGSPALAAAVPQVFAAFERISKNGFATTRDPRIALIDRLNESEDVTITSKMRPYLSDVDPAIAKIAATIVSKAGTPTAPITTALLNVPLPSDATLKALKGATARITMKGMGVITLDLLTDEAPITSAMFADLADKGRFNGLTFHRIVANFVIQGGSPGADEYDGITQQFMKEEVGLPSHLRGTLGISTRGHDTGDGQIFVNLIDNYRLDHQYTVFARITSGMDVVDRVQEGDVMESVQIIRKK